MHLSWNIRYKLKVTDVTAGLLFVCNFVDVHMHV